jgi:predicted transcriptional regulator
MTPDGIDAGRELVSYPEMARVVELLPTLVREKRRRDGLSLRAAGDALGVAGSTVKRFEDGTGGVSGETVPVLLRWVGEAVP